MTATKAWVEDAIKGGFNLFDTGDKREIKRILKTYSTNYENCFVLSPPDYEDSGVFQHVSEWLLRPEAWQAVGKTRGWQKNILNEEDITVDVWEDYWNSFFDGLADGKTSEEALAELTPTAGEAVTSE